MQRRPAPPPARMTDDIGDLLQRLPEVLADHLPVAVASRLPASVREDLDRRGLLRAERRAHQAAARRHRRAVRSAQGWTAVAALTSVAAVAQDAWGWLLVGTAALARAGVSWHSARRSQGAGEPMAAPTAALPSLPRGSRAAVPLRRGEAALVVLRRVVGELPPGPIADCGRTAVGAAAETVDAQRRQAAGVAACESAARAISDPALRAEVVATVDRLVADLECGAVGVEDLLAAASEVLAAAHFLPGMSDVVARPGAPRGTREPNGAVLVGTLGEAGVPGPGRWRSPGAADPPSPTGVPGATGVPGPAGSPSPPTVQGPTGVPYPTGASSSTGTRSSADTQSSAAVPPAADSVRAGVAQLEAVTALRSLAAGLRDLYRSPPTG